MKSKAEFLDRWEDYVNHFSMLGFNVQKKETWDKIKQTKESMRKLVQEVADECYEPKEKE